MIGRLIDSVVTSPVKLGTGCPTEITLAQCAANIEQLDLDGRRAVTRAEGASVAVDVEIAKQKCVSEMLEKVLSNSAAKVCNQSADHRWSDFAPYDEAKLARLEMQAENSWEHLSIPGRKLVSGAECYVPASRCLLDWQAYSGSKPVLGETDGSGLAACPTRASVDQAIGHGLMEVLERDALMLAWRLSSWTIADLDADCVDRDVLKIIMDSGMRVTLHELGDPDVQPVVLALLSDQSESRLTCGSACDLTMPRAATRAVLEATMLWNTCLCNPNHPANQWPRTSLDHVILAFREARKVREWFSGRQRRPLGTPAKNLAELAERSRSMSFGAEPIVVDFSQPDWSSYCSYRVLVPHAVRKEWSHDLPFIGGKRMSSMTHPSTRINPAPHPYG